jgi:hydroxymethylglutaryl-CoA reductase
MNEISGFSKLGKDEKINWLASQVGINDQNLIFDLKKFWHQDENEQKIFDEFAENTLTNYYLPFGIAPNFLINGKVYSVPMVIEESSVVAAAAKSAKFWLSRGGFKTRVISTEKNGQVHFFWKGDREILYNLFESNLKRIEDALYPIAKNMINRGGGIKNLSILDKTQDIPDYYQLFLTFETCDAMGANFINSILEKLANEFKAIVTEKYPLFSEQLIINMSILSNYTPQSIVKAEVECDINDFVDDTNSFTPHEFANRFVSALKIANVDTYRAVTHNKGIFNGIDAVVVATGNDFRAVEACGHAYAARSGKYSSLSNAKIENNKFHFSLEIPLSVGVVGGLTTLHPIAKSSLCILGNPHATELMQIIAAVGLAQNFSAVKSLITTGIQKGHMKMHMINILKQLNANEVEIEACKSYFTDKVVSFTEVRNFLQSMRIRQ